MIGVMTKNYTSAHLCYRHVPHIDVIPISISVNHVGVDVFPAVGHSDVDIRVVDHTKDVLRLVWPFDDVVQKQIHKRLI